jgi:hypothetical protein
MIKDEQKSFNIKQIIETGRNYSRIRGREGKSMWRNCFIGSSHTGRKQNPGG